MLSISFIIPTYRNNHSLQKCVNDIFELGNGIPSIKYEVIVVDNDFNSPQPIETLSAKFTQPVLYLKNPVVGAHHSRRLGLYNSFGDVIVFVDDDNYLQKEYVEFLIEKQNSGGGNFFAGTANREYKPVDWAALKMESTSFACGSLKGEKFPLDMPVYWGAGMAMSRSVAVDIFKDDLIVEGRKSKEKYIMSGEDHEISLRAYNYGAKFFYFEGIGLYHDFNTNRLNQTYYSQIGVGFTFAASLLTLYYLFAKKSFWITNFKLFYLYNLARGSAIFLINPFKMERQLIFLDSLQINQKKKHYNTARANSVIAK